MLEFFDVSYDELMEGGVDDLYRLRKIAFKDRLNWKVNCINGMEFDEFDNRDTRYILGIFEGWLVCSVRFCHMHQPNMITEVFQNYFGRAIPLRMNDAVEASRLFADKGRVQQLIGNSYPISYFIFLSMINYARYQGHHAMYAVVSRAMNSIMRRSGWKIKTLKESFGSKLEPIYLVSLPTREEDQSSLIRCIKNTQLCSDSVLSCWPLRVTPLLRFKVDKPQLNAQPNSLATV